MNIWNLHDCDQNFQGHTFFNVNVLETVRAIAEMRHYAFAEVDMRHKIATVNVVLRDLHFQGQTFSCYAFAINKLHMQRMSPTDLP